MTILTTYRNQCDLARTAIIEDLKPDKSVEIYQNCYDANLVNSYECQFGPQHLHSLVIKMEFHNFNP